MHGHHRNDVQIYIASTKDIKNAIDIYYASQKAKKAAAAPTTDTTAPVTPKKGKRGRPAGSKNKTTKTPKEKKAPKGKRGRTWPSVPVMLYLNILTQKPKALAKDIDKAIKKYQVSE